MNLPNIRRALADYHGPPLTFMEIFGTHTAAISENGIPAILSPHIHLISGPGCPVCVSVSAYIDRLCDLAMEPGMCVCTFGDLLRVPGSTRALEQCVAVGGRVQMVYSPLEVLSLAKAEPGTRFVFAAVGFETTAPVYAVLADTIMKEQIPNVQLLTALKTMPPAVRALCNGETKIDGFLAPGHVAVIFVSPLHSGNHRRRPLASTGCGARSALCDQRLYRGGATMQPVRAGSLSRARCMQKSLPCRRSTGGQPCGPSAGEPIL